MKYPVSLFFLAFSLVIPNFADARSFRTAQVPNNEWGCALCHISSRGGGPRTGFGEQVRDTLQQPLTLADVNWAAIAELDGDADGYSNGYELGDPEGTWMIGDPNPAGDVTNPARRESSPCGDGVLDPQEVCDTAELNGAQCSDEGYGEGDVSCSSTCRIDYSGCEGFVVPNNSNNTNNTNNTNNENANNQNNTNNQNSNNETNQNTNNDMIGDFDDMELAEDEGCSTTRGSFGLWALVLGLSGIRLNRRRTES